MAWKKTDSLLKKRLNQHGLLNVVEAGLVCKKAEELMPNTFTAVSVRNTTLHLEISKEQLMNFKLQEGKILKDLNAFVKLRNLPEITRIRLTFPPT